jgi:hypothetical protein
MTAKKRHDVEGLIGGLRLGGLVLKTFVAIEFTASGELGT